MLDKFLDALYPLKAKYERALLERRWNRLRAMGMQIGQGVNLPASTWVDHSHCFLISIGDWCGFGEQCLLLAHDGQMDEFLDAGLIGKIVIRESCHFGSRTVILPDVEIGPRTIVGANSVISNSLPPETVCAGAPARVICSLDDYLVRHQRQITTVKQFPWTEYNATVLTPHKTCELQAAVVNGPAYITGGFSQELRRRGGTFRTPHGETAMPAGVEWWKRRSRS
ncbi:MAG TPA: acyltransferase [Bryobacteraceae bacterium]|jgi:maltose O-acetyltransferase